MLQLLVLVTLFAAPTAGKPLPATNIACERNVVEITEERSHVFCSFATDTRNPLFSWSVQHEGRGASQTAFRVVVYIKDDGINPYWDTGKVSSGSMFVVYGGPPLKSVSSYFFTVEWWDHAGIAAPRSNRGCFVTGVLYNEWSSSGAEWITAKTISGAPLLRKEADMQDTVKVAMLSISGLGYYRVFVNGQEITSPANGSVNNLVGLRPGWTQYDLRCPYNTFDITRMMPQDHPGKLVIGVMLGLGWRNQKDYPNHDNLGKGEDQRVLKAMVNLTYWNGNNATIVSDTTWMVHSSPITSDAIYAGESYNANFEINNWASPDYTPTGKCTLHLSEVIVGSPVY